jgi:hypothetical protein
VCCCLLAEAGETRKGTKTEEGGKGLGSGNPLSFLKFVAHVVRMVSKQSLDATRDCFGKYMSHFMFKIDGFSWSELDLKSGIV